MSRQPLPIGAHGSIKTKDITPAGQTKPRIWQAQCRYRDADGETRQVKRTGRSMSAAENNLRAALTERRRTSAAGLTAESRVRVAAEQWLSRMRAKVDDDELASGTLRVYESAWRLHVAPGVGELRLREATVARCEEWLAALKTHKGASTCRSSRAVLSGILGHAARAGAIATNPCRDLDRIGGGPKRRPRALTRDEVTGWLDGMENHAAVVDELEAARAAGRRDAELRARLTALQAAVRWDVPDLTRFMLATGCRVGEALACTWDDVDLDAGTVALRWHLVRVTGDGLHRVKGTKRGEGRVVAVPGWCVSMLMHRRVSELAGWPIFPDSLGGWRDPSNVLRVLREARDATGFGWVTSHVFRKTTATMLEEAGRTPRQIADVLEHADPSLTQRVYFGRDAVARTDALEDLL